MPLIHALHPENIENVIAFIHGNNYHNPTDSIKKGHSNLIS